MSAYIYISLVPQIFSPTQKIKVFLIAVSKAQSFMMTKNAGAIPYEQEAWSNKVGWGCIIGEGCQFIDLMCYLAGSEIISVKVRRMVDPPRSVVSEGNAAIISGSGDGSFGTVDYLANWASSFPEERVEVFVAGHVLKLNSFRKTDRLRRAWVQEDESLAARQGRESLYSSFFAECREGAYLYNLPKGDVLGGEGVP